MRRVLPLLLVAAGLALIVYGLWAQGAPIRTPTWPLVHDVPGSVHARIGVGATVLGPELEAALGRLNPGWYLAWTALEEPPGPGEYWQMIRVTPDGYAPPAETITTIARARPGMAWIIGNEPDVTLQDNQLPETYAARYHELYVLIKQADPASRVAMAGVAQPTPLRLAYLDRVLAAYRASYGTELPVDVWTVHNYMLREERDGWGAGIPPGFDDAQGVLYEIEDSGNLELFRQQLVTFRRWMADRGYRDRALVVSEFSIPMPEEYGFPPERVQAFMRATYDYMLTAADAEIGYPRDGNRLVQRWAWFSTCYPPYPTSDLIDASTGALTPLGQVFAAIVADLP